MQILPNVLLVDNDLAMINNLGKIVKDFQLITFNTISEAYDSLDTSNVALIVINTALIGDVDSRMYTSFRSIALHRNIFFIYLSDEKNYLIHRFNSFCIDVIAKPIKEEKLVSRISLVLTEQREKLIYQGFLEDFPIDEVIKICESIIFTGVIIVKCNYDSAKLVFENGRLERAILDRETDWKVLDKILGWKTGKFQIFGNIERFSDNVFEKKANRRKTVDYVIKDSVLIEEILKQIKREMKDLLAIAIVDHQANIVAKQVMVESLQLDNHHDGIRQIVYYTRMMLLSIHSNVLNEIVISGDLHNIIIHKIGNHKLFYITYIKKTANLGMLKLVLQNFENQILAAVE